MIANKKQTTKKNNNAKMILGIICVTAVVVSGYFSLSTFWFWTCVEIIGGFLVAVGCVGEWRLFGKPARKGHELIHKRSELQCIVAVAIGVCMEFSAILHSIPATIALERNVVDIGTTNTQLVASNLVIASQVEQLRKQNDELESTAIRLKNAIPPRQIPEKQRELFIATLLQTNSGSPKIDIKVFAQEGNDSEANNFADSIRKMLNDADYGTNGESVIKIPPFNFYAPSAGKNARTPSIFAIYANDNNGKLIPLSMATMGGNMMPFYPTKNSVEVELGNPKLPTASYFSTNPNDIFGGVCNIFSYIGFSPATLVLPGLLKPGEVAFYIPPQVQ